MENPFKHFFSSNPESDLTGMAKEAFLGSDKPGRKFVADAEGNIGVEELSDEEKRVLDANKPKKLKEVITMERDRTFSVSPDGATRIVGDNEVKPKIKKL